MTLPNTTARRHLRLVSVIAATDAMLLAALITAAVRHAQNWVHVLGPLHGINYLILLATVALPALDGVWGWWFPLLVLLTGGPIGAFIGEWRVRRAEIGHEDIT